MVASLALVAGTAMVVSAPTSSYAQDSGDKKSKKPDFPKFEKVAGDLEQVVSTIDGAEPLYELYKDEKTGKLMGVLPRNFEKQLLMIACTVSGGDSQAGVMGPTHYAKWRRFDKQLALIAPNFFERTNDKEAANSVDSLYTGRVMLSVPIKAMKGGRPVIDLGEMGLGQANAFFGPSPWGQYGPGVGRLNTKLSTLTKAKAFPENFIFEYEVPRSDGQLIKLTYNFGSLEGSKGFKPRKADNRVGYFYNWFNDYAKPANADVTERYINRWNIEKADKDLDLSPPKEPLVWYIEHTTPIKYRRYVREGIEMWNESFEKIGIVGALEVRQQDATTGAHMNIDPEDARYNFFRWNVSNQGYAIGPSRTNPETGEILDADVVWHQGLTRAVRNMLESLSEDLTEQTFSPETLAFFDKNPDWDPRVRLASPARRAQLELQREMDLELAATEELESHDHPWTHGLNDPTNTACRIGNMLAMDLALSDVAATVGLLDLKSDATLDGMPEEFLGPMIRYISAHEVGHCLGLQHNMAASTIRELNVINSGEYDGPTVGSVMDYVAANINYELGEEQGPYATPVVGPYDDWAIAFGYGPDKEVEDVLAQSAQPDHIFVSQIETSVGSDPRNQTWDYGADNLEFAQSRIGLAKDLRSRLVDDLVDEGETWATVRRRYQQLVGTQAQMMFIASKWIGGSFTSNAVKGEPDSTSPITDVPASRQREALKLIMDNSFEDDALGLTPELIRHMGKEYFWDPSGINELIADPNFTAHDLVGAIQGLGLTLVMNPQTLRRVYDNEFRYEGSDEFTMAELIKTVTDRVWDAGGGSKQEMGSFRRNLQREHVGRLIDLAVMDSSSPSLRAISTLATAELRRVDEMASRAQRDSGDDYVKAHLTDVRTRIERALEASYYLRP